MSVSLPASATAESMAGTYQLRLVATSGAKRGAVADGVLWLQPHDSTRRQVTVLGRVRDSVFIQPYFGAAEIAVDSVGAVAVGTLTSRDPDHPGVLVIERRSVPGKDSPAEIILRLGSEANRSDRSRFDGGYTVLRVRQLSSSAFSGDWSSGVMRERAAGYFCARRAE